MIRTHDEAPILHVLDTEPRSAFLMEMNVRRSRNDLQGAHRTRGDGSIEGGRIGLCKALVADNPDLIRARIELKHVGELGHALGEPATTVQIGSYEHHVYSRATSADPQSDREDSGREPQSISIGKLSKPS